MPIDAKTVKRFIAPYRVESGRKFRLGEHDPDDTHGLEVDKEQAQELLRDGVRRLAELQDKLYAQDRWAVLLIFQAMDAAGKDGAIKHVMSGVNPQGCQVHAFKAPSSEELDHDFLWRCNRALPERGRIGIFNRSYYEEVLVVRVHQEILRNQKLPPHLVTRQIWHERYEDIRNYESYLARNGVLIRKFFLNVSKGEQKRRFMARLDEADKNWKFSPTDVAERGHWKTYMAAYDDAIRETSAAHAPWFVVPADNKWFTRLVIAAAIIDGLEDLDLAYPTLDARARRELETARKMLVSEK